MNDSRESKLYESKLRYARFWLDLGCRLACLPSCPSARPACTRSPRKSRTVPPPLPSPASAAGLRTSSDRPSIQATATPYFNISILMTHHHLCLVLMAVYRMNTGLTCFCLVLFHRLLWNRNCWQ